MTKLNETFSVLMKPVINSFIGSLKITEFLERSIASPILESSFNIWFEDSDAEPSSWRFSNTDKSVFTSFWKTSASLFQLIAAISSLVKFPPEKLASSPTTLL